MPDKAIENLKGKIKNHRIHETFYRRKYQHVQENHPLIYHRTADDHCIFGRALGKW